MNSALIIEVIAIVLGLIMMANNRNDLSSRRFYVFFITTLLILESGLRSLTVGPDTEAYLSGFIWCKTEGWGDLLSNEAGHRDYGFFVLIKFIQLFSDDFNVFLTIAALWFFIPLAIILYRYSSHTLQLVFAFTLYCSLFHIIALSGIRQQIAMGFSFVAFLNMMRGNYFKSAIWLILGSFIHVSLILFFAFWGIKRFINAQYYKKIHALLLLVSPVVVFGGGRIVSFMAGFLNDEYYQGYALGLEGGAYVYIILMEILSLICLIYIPLKRVVESSTMAQCYVALPLLTFFVPLINTDGTLIRMGQYFTVYLMLLVPFAFDYISERGMRNIFYFVSIIILAYYTVLSNFSYSFFWQ